MTTTYTEAIEQQTKIMLNIARRLDERGWAVLAHDTRLDGSMLRGVVTVANANGAKRRRRPAIVEVTLDSGALGGSPAANWTEARRLLKTDEWKKTPSKLPLQFRCRILRQKAYEPIHAALRLVANKVANRYHDQTRIGTMAYTEGEGFRDYVGHGKDSLTVLLHILDMPDHRKILLGQ